MSGRGSQAATLIEYFATGKSSDIAIEANQRAPATTAATEQSRLIAALRDRLGRLQVTFCEKRVADLFKEGGTCYAQRERGVAGREVVVAGVVIVVGLVIVGSSRFRVQWEVASVACTTDTPCTINDQQ
jgi:hypothetical protein